jgi:hypothetical protein
LIAYRWIRYPEFDAVWREASRAAFGQASLRLQQAAGTAVTALLNILVEPATPASVRARAADLTLIYGEKPIEEDIEPQTKHVPHRATQNNPEVLAAQSGPVGTTVRLAIYARVSTADQQCEMQLRDLRQYAAARGWTIAGEYVDTGWSGKNADRPALKRCVADAKARKWDAVAVWKMDRWGRTVQQLVNDINDFDSAGIRFIAITQSIDTDASKPWPGKPHRWPGPQS